MIRVPQVISIVIPLLPNGNILPLFDCEDLRLLEKLCDHRGNFHLELSSGQMENIGWLSNRSTVKRITAGSLFYFLTILYISNSLISYYFISYFWIAFFNIRYSTLAYINIFCIQDFQTVARNKMIKKAHSSKNMMVWENI